jgi:hypothetical protein
MMDKKRVVMGEVGVYNGFIEERSSCDEKDDE